MNGATMNPAEDPYLTKPELLQKLKDNPSEELNSEFVRKYVHFIKYIARKYNVPSEDMDDVVNDILHRLLTGELGKFEYDRQHRFRNWLYTFSKNFMLSFNRKYTARRRIAIDYVDDLAALGTDSPDEAVDKELVSYVDEKLQAILQGLKSSMSSRDYGIFCAIVIEEQDIAGVAEKFGVQRQVVDNVLFKGRKLARAMKDA